MTGSAGAPPPGNHRRRQADDGWTPATSRAEGPTVRRRKVTLTSAASPGPAEHSPRAEADAGRAHVAPGDGLDTFDLGSVPASVTPPRSWRRAAWFAGLSSGCVVVAMLIAASLLVGHAPGREGTDGWPGRYGGVPTMADDYRGEQPTLARPPTTSADPTTTTASTYDASEVADERRSRSADRASPPGHSNSGGNRTSDGPPGRPSTTREPQKPPVKPAPTSTEDDRILFRAHDPEKLGNRSQSFLDTVTENPAKAHSMTTGDLADEGPEGLRRRYASIAYFVVKHIHIDQHEGYTINTVETTYTDGSTHEETRKLSFDNNSKIADDGQ